MIEKSIIDGLVANPSETLTVEVKRWIDPTEPAGIEKTVKAAIALRNRNGGYFVVGFDNNTKLPDVENEPQSAPELFHVDEIQGLISKSKPEGRLIRYPTQHLREGDPHAHRLSYSQDHQYRVDDLSRRDPCRNSVILHQTVQEELAPWIESSKINMVRESLG